jgi:hypothetical protein
MERDLGPYGRLVIGYLLATGLRPSEGEGQ